MTIHTSGLKRKQARKGIMMTLPFLIFSLIFFVYPVIWAVNSNAHTLEFCRNTKFCRSGKYYKSPNKFSFLDLGLEYNKIFNLLYPNSFYRFDLLALALKELLFGRPIVIICFMLAQVASGVSYSIIFQKLFSSTGPINAFLSTHFHFTIPFFSSPDMAMFTIALMVTWKFLGYYALIFYSGINAIPRSIYEAADIDGAKTFCQIL